MVEFEGSPLSVVLVGYGLGGRVFHAPLIDAEPGLSLDAIVTSDAGRAAHARAAHPDVRVYPAADQAWAGGHDLAVISTANVTHVPYARAALTAGLHVVLDKPLAPTASAAQELADLATERGRHLIPFQNRRWDSDFRTAQAVAASGEIGTVHRFESRIERMRVMPKTGWRGSADPADMGGMLYDLGAHVVDQALALLGPVATVAAAVRSVRPADPTDDDVVLLLTHTSGAVSLLVVSQLGAFGQPRMTLLGTRGGLRIDASDSQESALARGDRPDSPTWGIEPDASAALLRRVDDANNGSDERRPLATGQWPLFYRGVVTALRGDAPDPVPVEDAIANLRVLDAARVAGSTGTVVRLDPPASHRS